MSHCCPRCQRVLYNRRLKDCGFCGATIPEELRFTPEEIAALDREMAVLQERRRQREEAEKQAKENAKRRDAGDTDIDLTGFF